MVGAGNRGHLAYGAFAERNPDKAKFVAVVEPDDGRRARFANRLPIESLIGPGPLAPVSKTSPKTAGMRSFIVPGLIGTTCARPSI